MPRSVAFNLLDEAVLTVLGRVLINSGNPLSDSMSATGGRYGHQPIRKPCRRSVMKAGPGPSCLGLHGKIGPAPPNAPYLRASMPSPAAPSRPEASWREVVAGDLFRSR